MDVTPYKKPEYFRNRELSWISFDERVLNEARDKSIPLFERLKFISITSSNLDEFLYGPCGFTKRPGACKLYEKGSVRHGCEGAAYRDQQTDA